MWSAICNYIHDKLFSKLTTGQKRRNEEWTDYPPVKQMKLDDKNRFDVENSFDFTDNMKKEDSILNDEECCTAAEIIPKKWSSSCTMARQSIHPSKYDLGSTLTLDKRKLESNTSNQLLKQPLYQSSNMGESEVVKYVTKTSPQNSGKLLKNKSSCNRLFNSYRTSNTRQNTDRPFQSNIKKSTNFLQESYRLSEKVQYMQLLQQQTTKLNSLLAPFTIQQIGSQKERKSPIPVIDLTKEKTNVLVDRSRENIPRTSSQTKSNDDPRLLDPSSNVRVYPVVNSLQDVLRTYPVVETNVVHDILSRHSAETAEKLRQAEAEKAKLEVLSKKNRKAYNDALEEKVRNYMRITTPAVIDVEVEEDEYVLPELTREQESKISSLLVPYPAAEVLVERYGLQIKRRDLQTLDGLHWLNDEVINFYMNLIMERGKETNKPKVYAFNTFFYPKLMSGGHASLRRWTKKVDLFSYDLILVPVHLGMHWCMSVVDFRSKEVRYYDSMGSSNNRCLRALLTYLEAESMDKKSEPFSTKGWKMINVKDIPHQMNGSDCGVFSCVFAEHLARDSPLLFTQANMPYFRKKMALEIVEAKLLT